MLSDSFDGYLALAGCLLVPGVVVLAILIWSCSRRRRWDYNREDKE